MGKMTIEQAIKALKHMNEWIMDGSYYKRAAEVAIEVMEEKLEADRMTGRQTTRKYTVEYREHSAGEVMQVTVQAKNKTDAYDRALYEVLDDLPYAAWVASVTYNNGKTRRFNTFEGKPY